MKRNSMHFDNTSTLFRCISHEIIGFFEMASNYYRNAFDLFKYTFDTILILLDGHPYKQLKFNNEM